MDSCEKCIPGLETNGTDFVVTALHNCDIGHDWPQSKVDLGPERAIQAGSFGRRQNPLARFERLLADVVRDQDDLERMQMLLTRFGSGRGEVIRPNRRRPALHGISGGMDGSHLSH